VIILWEISTAVICWFAAIMLFVSRQNYEKFQHYKIFAFFGLTLGFFLYLFPFITIGGEWFQMWQSPHWNVKNQAELSLCMIGIIILILIAPNDR
jgi:predicted small integral membrane protein